MILMILKMMMLMLLMMMMPKVIALWGDHGWQLDGDIDDIEDVDDDAAHDDDF